MEHFFLFDVVPLFTSPVINKSPASVDRLFILLTAWPKNKVLRKLFAPGI